MATIEEIDETVRFIEKENPEYIDSKKLGILQCVAMYGDQVIATLI